MSQKKKARILFDNLFVHRGGVEVVMWHIINRLVKEGYDVTLAAIHWAGDEEKDVIPPGVHFVRRYCRRKNYREHSPRWFANRIYARIYNALIANYLSLQNFDLAISMQEKWTMKRTDGIRAKRKIAWVHTDYSTRVKAEKGAFPTAAEEKACMQRFEKVVCVSETAKNGIIQTLGDPGNLCVLYNPIDANGIRARAQAPCPVKRDADRPLLVSVGRLVAEKQYLMLLKACRLLQETVPFDLWIIGDGEERETLEKYITEHHMSYVRLLGAQDNPFPYVCQADLFVSSSVTEGYGLTIQEALILDVPVVAVSCPAVLESLDPRYGLLTGNSETELAEGMKKVLQHPELMKSFREKITGACLGEEMYEKRLQAICGLLKSVGNV